jgi:two-component system response regulator WspF
MQVGIVNDIRLIAEALRRIVAETPGFAVAWVARDGESAIEHHRERPADIVLMDLIMPGLDGAETTEAIMKLRSTAVLVVTATVVGNRDLVYAAMNKGALDAVNTPDAASPHSVAELRRKLTTVSRLVKSSTAQAQRHAPQPGHARSDLSKHHAAHDERTPAVVGIGASTGGPQAIATILRGLPSDFNAAIVIVQHLDRQFVPGLERWLQRESQLPVYLAANDEPIHRSGVWLADTENHLILKHAPNGALRIQYTEHPLEAANRPSVDIFFGSLAQLRGTHRCGVLLTGMGADGADGLLAMRNSGSATFAQDAESCIVYGMPAVALKRGAIEHSTRLADISTRLLEFAGQTATATIT